MGEDTGCLEVSVDPNGPVVVPGPVSVQVAGGETVLVKRFRVALCACGRSGSYPLCDSSHRRLRG